MNSRKLILKLYLTAGIDGVDDKIEEMNPAGHIERIASNRSADRTSLDRPPQDPVIGPLQTLLPDSVSRRIELFRASAKVKKYSSKALESVPSVMAVRCDLGRIERLWDREKGQFQEDPVSAAKYADYDRWIWFNIDRAARLGLHEGPPRKMFDIGCGPGYLVAVARALGHEAYGADIPEEMFTAIERRVYAELLAALRIDRNVSRLLVQRYEPLAIEHRDLDLITAFWICFNCHDQTDEWGVEEWKFFVADALTRLRPGGTIHLELNENAKRYGALRWYDEATLDYFRSAGSVEGNCIRIRRS